MKRNRNEQVNFPVGGRLEQILSKHPAQFLADLTAALVFEPVKELLDDPALVETAKGGRQLYVRSSPEELCHGIVGYFFKPCFGEIRQAIQADYLLSVDERGVASGTKVWIEEGDEVGEIVVKRHEMKGDVNEKMRHGEVTKAT